MNSRGGERRSWTPYRGTSLIRKRPPPQDFRRALDIPLLQGHRGARFLMSKVPLYRDYSKSKIRTLRSYGRASPRSMCPPYRGTSAERTPLLEGRSDGVFSVRVESREEIVRFWVCVSKV